MNPTHSFSFEFEILTIAQLSAEVMALKEAADQSIHLSYSPYSGFGVVCALRLDSGRIVTGVNIENAAYSSCICAERTAVSTVLTQYPEEKVVDIFIAVSSASTQKDAGFASPCGECRQVLFELAERYAHSIPLYLFKNNEEILRLSDLRHLLPFGFSGKQLK